MKIKIGDISRAQREELFNLHAMYVNPDAMEQVFNLSYVQVKMIDLTAIPKEELYTMTEESRIAYSNMSKHTSTKYPVISGTALIDGLHRITAQILDGKKTMEVLDFGKLLDPEQSGKQFDIKLATQKLKI